MLALPDRAAGAWTPAAAAASGEDAPPQQGALLDLVVNEARAGQVFALIRRGDILVPADALHRAGMRGVAGRREAIGAQSFVSLASLAPGIAYKLDEKALVLQVTAPADSFGVHRVDLSRRQRPDFTFSRTTSAFLNYGVDWRQASGSSATAELGVSVGGAFLTTTGSWQQGNRYIPGLSSLTYDDRTHLRRIVVGESFAGDRLLGSTLLLAGVRVAREYGVDPYFIQYPLLGMTGAVNTPSTLEVYVDGRLVRQERLQTGRFELANIPVPVGSSRTRVLIRDAFGREQEMRAPYYLTNRALAAGLHEYEYAAGFPRVSTQYDPADYRSPVVLARHRYGFSDMVTAGVRFESGSRIVDGGPSVNLRTRFGEMELSAAMSGGEAGAGGALALGYAWIGTAFSAGISTRAASPGYRTLSAALLGRQGRFEVNVHGSLRLGARSSVSLQHAQGDSSLGVTQERTSVFGSTRLSRRTHLVLSLGQTRANGERKREASVGLTVALGNRTVASLSGGIANDRASSSFEVRRSLSQGQGYGYRVRTGVAGDPFAGGRFEYQSPYGRYEFGQETRGGMSSATVSAAGGLVAIGGGLHPTRPVQQGFALLRVPGVPNVRGYLSNQPVGRTNGRGDILIPNLLPYYANRISIADEDVPIGHELETREQAVAPPYRGGALVTFKAAKVLAATGTVRVGLDGVDVVPEYGDLVVETPGGVLRSPIGRGGHYYVEHLAPGRYTATVLYRGASCAFDVTVPVSPGPVVNLGPSGCRLESRQK